MNGAIVPSEAERFFVNATASKLSCKSASGDRMQAGKVGNFPIVCKSKGAKGEGEFTIENFTSHSCKNINQYIMGIHPLFSTGNWDFLWRSELRGGCAMVKYVDGSNVIEKIVPLEYNTKDRTTYLEFTPLASSQNNIIDLAKQNKTRKCKIRKLTAIDPSDCKSVKLGCLRMYSDYSSMPPTKELLKRMSELIEVEYIVGIENGKQWDMVDSLREIRHEGEFSMMGSKRNMSKNKKVIPLAVFSAKHGHLGCKGLKCEICIRKRGNRRELNQIPNATHRENKRGFRWRLDVCTWDVRNLEGEKYAFVLRDCASSAFKIMHDVYRTDFTPLFIEWVEEIRNSPYMKGEEHRAVSYVKTDFDGVWREDVSLFQKEMRVLGIVFSYNPPERKEGGAERNIGVYEETVKAMLLERNLAGPYWGQASRDAEFLLNRFPTTASVKSVDGDAIRPLEYLTGGMISRAQIDKEINAHVTLGTVCLVHDERKKGSQQGAKVRFGISWGMIGDVNRFKCPYTGAVFRSSSFSLIGLPCHISFSQFLNLPDFSSKNCLPKSGDFRIDASSVTTIPTTRSWQKDVLTDIKITCQKDGGEKINKSEFYIARKSNLGLPESDYSLHDSLYIGRKVQKYFDGYSQPFLGEVTSHDVDSENSDTIWETTFEDGDVGWYNHRELMQILLPELPGIKPTQSEKKESGEDSQENMDARIRQIIKQTEDYVSKSTDTFQDVCFRLNLPHPWHKIYYDWLSPTTRCLIKFPFTKGKENNIKVPCIKFPNPINDPKFHDAINNLWVNNDVRAPQSLIDRAVSQIQEGELRKDRSSNANRQSRNESNTFYNVPTIKMTKKKLPTEKEDDPPFLYYVETSTQKLLHASPLTSKIMPPNNVQDAIDRDDIELLLEGWDTEIAQLGEFGAITHDHTKDDLSRLGITTPSIPTRMISDIKYSDGKLTKYKGRCVAQGFRMIKGVHYDGKTFSPTPNQHTNKVMMAHVAGEDLSCLSFDIRLAYTWGEREGGHKIALSYPPGFRRWNSEGEELFMISHRAHYGLSPAGREWFNTRQKALLELLNNEQFSSFVAKSEPCLMSIVHWPKGKPTNFKLKEINLSVKNVEDDQMPPHIIKSKNEIERLGGALCHMLTHVDDVDLIGKNPTSLREIFKVVEAKWPVKEVPSEFMLGMKREIFKKDGISFVKLTQGACAREHFDKFIKYMPKKIPRLPIAPGQTLNKSHEGKTDREVKEVIELGYQKVVGVCLWLARGVVPESLFAVSQVCSLMARPSWAAWEVACKILAYQTPVAEKRGIVFRSDGNKEPIILVDAAFKPNPHTGKSQYGIVAMLYGGPIVTISKSLNHVGLSTPHVEMMALNQGARVSAWLRNLHAELCRPLQNKTLLLSDSTVGIHVTNEQIISEKNKFVLIAYHYIDELRNDLEIHFLGTKKMLADVLTKATLPGIFESITPLMTGNGASPFKFTPQTFRGSGCNAILAGELLHLHRGRVLEPSTYINPEEIPL